MNTFIIGFITGLMICLIIYIIWKLKEEEYFKGYMDAIDDANRELRKNIEKIRK